MDLNSPSFGFFCFSVSCVCCPSTPVVQAIGIGVEFCIHLTVCFLKATGTRHQRISYALEHVGSSIVSGITLTKFSGVIVLAAASSELFRIYCQLLWEDPFSIILLSTS